MFWCCRSLFLSWGCVGLPFAALVGSSGFVRSAPWLLVFALRSRDRFAGLVFQLVGSLLAGFAFGGLCCRRYGAREVDEALGPQCSPWAASSTPPLSGQQSSTDSEEPQACKRPGGECDSERCFLCPPRRPGPSRSRRRSVPSPMTSYCSKTVLVSCSSCRSQLRVSCQHV